MIPLPNKWEDLVSRILVSNQLFIPIQSESHGWYAGHPENYHSRDYHKGSYVSRDYDKSDVSQGLAQIYF